MPEVLKGAVRLFAVFPDARQVHDRARHRAVRRADRVATHRKGQPVHLRLPDSFSGAGLPAGRPCPG